MFYGSSLTVFYMIEILVFYLILKLFFKIHRYISYSKSSFALDALYKHALWSNNSLRLYNNSIIYVNVVNIFCPWCNVIPYNKSLNLSDMCSMLLDQKLLADLFPSKCHPLISLHETKTSFLIVKNIVELRSLERIGSELKFLASDAWCMDLKPGPKTWISWSGVICFLEWCLTIQYTLQIFSPINNP